MKLTCMLEIDLRSAKKDRMKLFSILSLACIGMIGSMVIFSFPALAGESTNKGKEHKPFQQSVIHEGIRVTLTLDHIDPAKTPGTFKEGDDIRFQFSIQDTLTQKGLSGAFPAAWMDAAADENGDKSPCLQKISAFLSGGLFHRAELDLNVYYVLAMNKGPSITIVDPLFGYNNTKLLALVPLNSPGLDWTFKEAQDVFYVSLPATKEIAVVNAFNWKVDRYIPLQAKPSRIVLQPDEQYLWASYQIPRLETQASGVAVINTGDHTIRKMIPTGAGPHDIVINDHNTHAYISNKGDGSLSVIRIQEDFRQKKISLGGDPYAIAYSPVADALYVTDSKNGRVQVIDGKAQTIMATIPSDPGISQIRFDPSGRWAIIVNPENDKIYVLDAASNKIVQQGKVGSGPCRVSFSDELAYIIHRNSEIVYMIPIGEIGKPGEPIPVVDFPGGQHPPGQTDFPSLADGIVQAPGANAVLVANPKDQSIYYYAEGMAAPMGNFSNYGREPRAVAVIDRSLEEKTPGVYETVAKLRKPGQYDIAFFMDVPRFTHCFPVTVLPDEQTRIRETKKNLGALKVEHLPGAQTLFVGREYALAIRLKDPEVMEPLTGLPDVRIMAMSPAGYGSQMLEATEPENNGTYKATFTFRKAGVYYIYAECLSKGLALNNPQYRVLNVINNDQQE